MTPAAAPSRIAALDGLRGVLALMVVASHYIGEVPHGIAAALVGWIAVKVFFVLSGFLMMQVIQRHLETPGFFTTFYVRRACRTLPAYLFTLAIVFGALHVFRDEAWMDAGRLFPLWRYLTFTQTIEMIARGDHGTEWLTPTWTLTAEEQFYVVAPLMYLLAGRRHLLAVLATAALASVAFRYLSFGVGVLPEMAALVLLPGVAHSMFFGMIAALLLSSDRMNWRRLDPLLRVAPMLLLIAVALAKLAGGEAGTVYQCLGVPLVSIGAAALLVSIVRGAPEAQRLHAPLLAALGRLSFGIYLLHMPVLGLMHGMILGAKPDIVTPTQWAVTLTAILATLLLAWGVNRTIEEPMIAFGRRWTFARS